MPTYTTLQDLIATINATIVSNGVNDITGDEHNYVENGLAFFIQQSILNNDKATIVSTGGVISLPAPFTVISGTVPTSISWADNIYNEYYIVNATGSSIPLAAGYSFFDTYNTQQTIIPARAIVHIIKAKNNNWFQANTIVTAIIPAPNISTKVANYAIVTTDDTILVDTTSGPVTITYNPALDTKIRRVKNIGEAANNVTVVPLTGTIDGLSSNIIGDFEVITIQSNLTNLFLL